ncbi:YbaB/EbfC family DNA-binding protein [Mycolicibacterium sp. GF69]|nr:YbaB/EbfC family DNA-binding protein [Mycolicibacterium sp. GF69]RAV08220.1 YbaB/EbfC family DNA-binding protein [Mycolicibacterium sp. GF69]
MVGESPPLGHDDERGDVAASESGVRTERAEPSDLDAWDLDAHVEPVAGASAVPAVTVTNPPGTVTVSAFPDGRVAGIELSPKASELTEDELAAEIVVIAGLASQDAKSAQFTSMLEGMRAQGHDDAATRDFLGRDLDLPSPEQARAERARVFATRYPDDHE